MTSRKRPAARSPRGYTPIRLPSASAPSFVTMSRPGQVLIGIQIGEIVHHVSGDTDEAIDSAWRILDSARNAMLKDGRIPPAELTQTIDVLQKLKTKL